VKFKATGAAFACTIGLLGLGGCATATQEQVVPAETSSRGPKVATTVQNNEVVFQADRGVRSVNFEYSGSFNVTPGQPWEGVGVGWTGHKVLLNARAGRSNSAGVANWYNDRVDNGATTALRPWSSKPNDLNFAFTGTLIINDARYGTTVGQGSSGVSNNWFIGSKGWVPVEESGRVATDRVMTQDRKYTIARDSGSTDVSWRVTQN